MSNVIAKDALAKIAISKNLIKEYKTSESERTVYLDNETEFQVYLKNPYQYHLGIQIYMNDKPIGSKLVLRPGQSYWLDRYLDNDSRFLFSTYEVENSTEMKYATAKNGKVKVEFYKEKEKSPYITQVYYNGNPCVCATDAFDTVLTSCECATDAFDSVLTSCECAVNSAYTTLNACDCNPVTCSNSATSSAKGISDSLKSIRSEIDKSATEKLSAQSTMETGRVEKGSKSDQKFEYCDIDFEYYPFSTETIQILPRSRKQITVNEIKRKYCSQCGSKVSPKDKFCSNCGAKLQ